MSLLELHAITRRFGGLTALDTVSFSVEPGAIVGLIGPNGAGKTTLFNAIAGSIPPSSGRVVFDGRDITGWRPNQVARHGIARTFQLMKPFASLSVVDNVTVAAFLRHPAQADAEEVARTIVARTGLETWADRQAGTLSTAGRKRLEVARALAIDPKLVLLDEVMAGLVPAERGPVIELLREVREEGVTLLLVEHVMAAVMALCDRIVVLHHGELLADGTPAEIVKDPAVIDAYFGEEVLLAGS